MFLITICLIIQLFKYTFRIISKTRRKSNITSSFLDSFLTFFQGILWSQWSCDSQKKNCVKLSIDNNARGMDTHARETERICTRENRRNFYLLGDKEGDAERKKLFLGQLFAEIHEKLHTELPNEIISLIKVFQQKTVRSEDEKDGTSSVQIEVDAQPDIAFFFIFL